MLRSPAHLLATLLGAASLCVAAAPLSAQSGIDGRVSNNTLLMPNRASQAAATFELARVFPRLELPPIVSLRQSGDTFYALAINGMLFSFPAVEDPDPAALALRLDIRALLGTTDRDQGSYCVALDPDFATNNRVYVNYASNVEDRLTVSRFTLGGSPTDAAATEEVFFRADLPTGLLHYGGTVEFGPDGKLYISTGDGNNGINAQTPGSLLGKMLRIDVTGAPDEGLTYAVPSDNPFVGVAGFRPEIWALGLRNPYRFSFDAPTGRLFVGDPGEQEMEEVSIVRKGGNYGWPFLEGTLPFEESAQADRVDLIAPLHTYDPEGRQALIGGYVYRGTAIPSLVGKYLFGDFVSGRLLALDLVDEIVISETPIAALENDPLGAISRDAAGEIYVTGFATAGIYKLKAIGTPVTVEQQVSGLLGQGRTVDLNSDGAADAADVVEAQNGAAAVFFSRSN